MTHYIQRPATAELQPPYARRPDCCDREPYIETEDLSLSYNGQSAFRDLTLNVNRHCLTALVGPSGCGKTSFLNALNRLTDLIQGCRLTGRLRIGGEDILAPKNNVVALRRRVGMIFQKPNPFPFTIHKNLAMPLAEHRVRDKNTIAQRIEESLRAVGLWEEVKDRLHAPAFNLSGGQQQRLCLARALVLQPEVLLLDEPCSALDPISAGVVEELIASLRGQYTLLMVTHNLAQARRIADDVAVFWVVDGAGQLIESGKTSHIFEDPQHPLTRAYVSGEQG